MKTSHLLQSAASVVAVIGALLAHTSTQAESAPSLKCVATAGQTNAYSLEITLQGESGREVIGGTFLVSSRNAGSNLVGLWVKGQLRPKPGSPPPGGYRPPYYGPSLNAYTMGMPVDSRELIIDERGALVRQAGDTALPIPLGQLALSLVSQFPAEAQETWTQEQDVFVMDEPLLQGPAASFMSPPGSFSYMPYYPGRPSQAVLAARQKVTFKVTAQTADTVTLRKTLGLDSRMLTGTEPRVSASGEGEVVVNRASGLPQRIQLDCKTVVVTDNLSRRSVLGLRWQLLEGAEREAALVPPPPPQPAEGKTLGPADLEKLVARVKSEEPGARLMALNELSNAKIESPTPELLSAITALASDRDESTRRMALTVLANIGTKDSVPTLIKALNEQDSSARTAAVKGLGRLKDPRAAEPLAALLASGQTEGHYGTPRETPVSEALIRIGPVAETAVRAVLKEKNVDTRTQACLVLKAIGSKKSLPELKELALHPNKGLSEAAAEACRAIQSRESN